MKAMGAESDQEIIQMVGEDEKYAALLVPTIQDCKQKGIFTQGQALDYLGGWRGCNTGGGGRLQQQQDSRQLRQQQQCWQKYIAKARMHLPSIRPS
eukprot:330704-Chlamydomonas_euryale.AAC.1